MPACWGGRLEPADAADGAAGRPAKQDGLVLHQDRRGAGKGRGSGARAHFAVIGKDHDYHACVSRPIEQRKGVEIIERYRGPIVAAWYEGATRLTLLALRLEHGKAWASTDSGLRFGWEIAHANLSDEHDPGVGVMTPLRFRGRVRYQRSSVRTRTVPVWSSPGLIGRSRMMEARCTGRAGA